VTFSLRVVQATGESKRFASGLTSFMQVKMEIGFIGIAFDLASILRTLLATPTYESDVCVRSAEAGSGRQLWTPSAVRSSMKCLLIVHLVTWSPSYQAFDKGLHDIPLGWFLGGPNNRRHCRRQLGKLSQVGIQC
jgi:hypothetical protein